MNRYAQILATLIVAASSFGEPASDRPSVEVAKFRFSRKNHGGYERLVLEFKRRSGEAKAPNVKLVSPILTKDAQIAISDTLLTGSVPEAMINESFVSKSRILGPLTVNVDEPTNGFTIRMALKEPVARVEPFWVEKPSRLVVDIFPYGAEKVDAKHRGARRGVASKGKGSAFEQEEPILCFPLKAQVTAAITFQPKGYGYGHELGNQQFDALSSLTQNADPNSILCFPASTQLSASVGFVPKDGAGLPGVKDIGAEASHAPASVEPKNELANPLLAPPGFGAPVEAAPEAAAAIQAPAGPPGADASAAPPFTLTPP